MTLLLPSSKSGSLGPTRPLRWSSERNKGGYDSQIPTNTLNFFSSDGLLLYLDDGGYYDFLELKLVKIKLMIFLF